MKNFDQRREITFQNLFTMGAWDKTQEEEMGWGCICVSIELEMETVKASFQEFVRLLVFTAVLHMHATKNCSNSDFLQLHGCPNNCLFILRAQHSNSKTEWA
jgi:hypothetical protein